MKIDTAKSQEQQKKLELAETMHEKGGNNAYIAQQLGISESVVRDILKP